MASRNRQPRESRGASVQHGCHRDPDISAPRCASQDADILLRSTWLTLTSRQPKTMLSIMFERGFSDEVLAPFPAPLPGEACMAAAPAAQRSARLNKASVRPQACCAAAASKRGVVSLLKPCCLPAYPKAPCLTPAVLRAASHAGQAALMRSSLSAKVSSRSALRRPAWSLAAGAAQKAAPARSSGTRVASRLTMPPP